MAHDVLIIGGGPAGLMAARTAGRPKLKPFWWVAWRDCCRWLLPWSEKSDADDADEFSVCPSGPQYPRCPRSGFHLRSCRPRHWPLP